MCRQLHTYSKRRTNLYNKKTDTIDSISAANQQIHELRSKIQGLESQVEMQKKIIAEEPAMRYKAWQQLADARKESTTIEYETTDFLTGR